MCIFNAGEASVAWRKNRRPQRLALRGLPVASLALRHRSAYDAERDVIILQAADLDDDPVATIELPRRVPLGFHDNWVPVSC